VSYQDLETNHWFFSQSSTSLRTNIFADALTLLKLALKLLTLSGNLIETIVIVREVAPLFLDFALQSLPVSFNAIPIHCQFPSWRGSIDATFDPR
jgi:hypothetical protein